ncbi:hypothetical protein DL96DRAFT_1701789 [Flagelloscypha sp. PMI_526]|nr:hypothetical protein DL96DRAFT_1701789 [Flagelloscypha sp. PMI_526]
MADSVEVEDLILILLALFFPPGKHAVLVVCIRNSWNPPGTAILISGCGSDLVINIILTLLFWFPGTLHAFWLIYQKIRSRQRWMSGRDDQLTFAKL